MLVSGKVFIEEVVEEVIRFGYKTIQDIEDDLKRYECVYKGRRITYVGLLRDLMILKDCEKYFSAAFLELKFVIDGFGSINR